MSSQRSTRDRLVQLLIDQASPDSEVDLAKLADAFGYSSLQTLALLKSVNAEFGTSFSFEDLENARGKGGLVSLLTSAESS